MFRPLKKLAARSSDLVFDFVRDEVVRKADLCTDILAEARRHSQLGKYGQPLNALVARAGDLLDDIDEMLVVLKPEDDWRQFALAATLHREFEQIEAAISAMRRARASMAKATGKTAASGES
jgi:hypothetical protein